MAVRSRRRSADFNLYWLCRRLLQLVLTVSCEASQLELFVYISSIEKFVSFKQFKDKV